ncbi:CYTH-like domain-containing protein [Spinellus fusiger]|nr:CYTH-like domain-containing protein [Spinellus fusiger]
MSLPREPSIFNIRPVDDITKYIADFLWEHCQQPNVEIEAKLGVFIDKQTRERLDIGAITETVLFPIGSGIRFESDMSLAQHKHFNDILNDLTNKSQARDYKGERIVYKHTRELDQFFQVSQHQKVRVTTDQATQTIVPNGILDKRRVVDINIHRPNQPLDYRISVSLEVPAKKPRHATAVYERYKDRLSYAHGGFVFDLTQVKGAPDSTQEIRHELEVEIIDCQLLAERARQGRDRSAYVQMIQVFINNIRLMSQFSQK